MDPSFLLGVVFYLNPQGKPVLLTSLGQVIRISVRRDQLGDGQTILLALAEPRFQISLWMEYIMSHDVIALVKDLVW